MAEIVGIEPTSEGLEASVFPLDEISMWEKMPPLPWRESIASPKTLFGRHSGSRAYRPLLRIPTQLLVLSARSD